jgi:SanA protein
MQAAVDLYKAGKTKVLLLSGDNHVTGYDEPTDMRNTLVEQGVPESALVLDHAGLRTLDSVVRAKEVFGVQRMTIVSERFHDYRALFICRRYGIEAVALCSDDVPLGFSLKVLIREVFARVKAVFDLYLLQTRPKFLGEKIKIVAVRWHCESVGVRTCVGVCSTTMEAVL